MSLCPIQLRIRTAFVLPRASMSESVSKGNQKFFTLFLLVNKQNMVHLKLRR
jgi:hypothetical protein